MDMHNNRKPPLFSYRYATANAPLGIVHGDIKPANVIVFKEAPERYTARVIDFGFSSLYIHDNEKLLLPKSVPWNAPETEGRQSEWSPLEAVRADLFSFGMLCLWLMFEVPLSEIRSHLTLTDAGFSSPGYQTLKRLKEIDKLQEYVQQLLSLEVDLDSNVKSALEGLFDSTLSRDPMQRRIGSLQEFVGKLDPKR